MNDPRSPRERGIDDFTAGRGFNECPFQGFSSDIIELRWQWQKGWLHARLEEEDLQKAARAKQDEERY